MASKRVFFLFWPAKKFLSVKLARRLKKLPTPVMDYTDCLIIDRNKCFIVLFLTIEYFISPLVSSFVAH